MTTGQFKVISVDLHKYMYETFNRLEGADCRTEADNIVEADALSRCEQHNSQPDGRFWMYTCEFSLP